MKKGEKKKPKQEPKQTPLAEQLTRIREIAKDRLMLVEWFNEHWYVVPEEWVDAQWKLKWGMSQAEKKIFVPSVTTKLSASPKPYLSTWRGQVGNWEADRVMNEAQKKGTAVHHAVDIMLKAGMVIYNNPKRPIYTHEEILAMTKDLPYCIVEDQQVALEVYRAKKIFNRMKGIKIISTEFNVFNLDEFYAGTVDGMMYMPDGSYELTEGRGVDLMAGYYLWDIKTGNSAGEAQKQLAAYAIAVEKQMGIKVNGAFCIRTNMKGVVGYGMEYFSRAMLEEYYQQFLTVSKVWHIYPTEKPKVFDLPNIITL